MPVLKQKRWKTRGLQPLPPEFRTRQSLLSGQT